ncbi:MAG: hypothetical protein HC868_16155, partial [Sphingomonadales bacterium]|nr:hypothetical protein [Sphingomonadales bacterium]
MCDFLHPGWLDPLYKPHFVCFDCRKQFKLRDAAVERFWQQRSGNQPSWALPDRAQVGAVCPDCTSLMTPVCACFEPPPRHSLKRWKKLRATFERVAVPSSGADAFAGAAASSR